MEELKGLKELEEMEEGCGATMLKQWSIMGFENSKVTFEPFLFQYGKVFDCDLYEEFDTLEEFMEDEFDIKRSIESKLSVSEFVNKLKLEKRTMAISITTWDSMVHCFILSNGIISDSYINVRGLEIRPFLFEQFEQFLTRPFVSLYNQIFICNDDEYDVPSRSATSIVIAYSS